VELAGPLADTGLMPVSESAVIVPVPEAERVVGRFRSECDSAARLGVPAHVTVISPFVPPDRVDTNLISALAAVIESVAVFDVTFTRTRWFGDRVLWLAPEPVAAFVGLIRAVWERFPDCPPYGGAHEDVVPHLTIGHDQEAGTLHAAARAIEPLLPVTTQVTEALLMQGSAEPGSWHTIAQLPLRSG